MAKAGTTIDASKPVDGVDAVKADLRANLAEIEEEILYLQVNIATSDPTASDDASAGYRAGSLWLNTSTPAWFGCRDATVASPPAAVWDSLGTGGGGAVDSVNGETGTVVLDATEIDISALSPGNYTPADASVEGHLSGINTALGAITAGADAAPVQQAASGATYELLPARQLHTNAENATSQASQRLNVPEDDAAGRSYLVYFGHDGATIGVTGDAGSVNGVSGGTVTGINGGFAIVRIESNAGTAPVVKIRGSILTPPIDVGTTKSYDNDDSNQDYRLTTTSTQTFVAAANYGAGFYVNLFKETSGNVTIDGVDADYTLTGPGVVTVKKLGTALLAFGSDGVTILDAA